MSNTLITSDMVADRGLARFHEKAAFIGTISRNYDDEFAKKGKKAGDTIRLKNPNRYVRRQGSRVMDVQPITNTTQDLTVSTQDGVDCEVNSAEATLSLDDMDEEFIGPAMDQLASGIDGDVLVYAIKRTFNTVGTPGAVPGASNDITVLGQARARLNQYLAEKKNRAMHVDSMTMASIVNAMKLQPQPSEDIAEAIREGFMSRTAMADFYENERIWTLTNPGDVAGEIDESTETNFTEGSTTVHMDGLTTASDIVAGMVFTWEGLYAVHPETKQVYSHLQDFTVISVANPSSGDADVTFSPAIYTTGAKLNVKTATGAAVTWTSTGQDGKDITFRGNASTAYKYGLMCAKTAFVFASADLVLSKTGECSRRNHEGIALRFWRSGDIVNDRELARFDCLYGMKDTQPEKACRIILN